MKGECRRGKDGNVCLDEIYYTAPELLFYTHFIPFIKERNMSVWLAQSEDGLNGEQGYGDDDISGAAGGDFPKSTRYVSRHYII